MAPIQIYNSLGVFERKGPEVEQCYSKTQEILQGILSVSHSNSYSNSLYSSGFFERNHEWLHTSKFSAWCSIHLWEWQEPHGLEDNLVVPSIIFYSPWHCLVCWGSMFCPFEGYESLLMKNKNRPMSIGRRIPFWPLSRLQECQYQTLTFLP